MTIKLSAALYDCGDGSHSITWFKDMPTELLYCLEDEDPDRWSSGDGFQLREYTFPDDFDFDSAGFTIDDIREFLPDDFDYAKYGVEFEDEDEDE